MSDDTPKQNPAQLDFLRAKEANPLAHSTPRVAKTEMTEQEKAQHDAFIAGHPIAKTE